MLEVELSLLQIHLEFLSPRASERDLFGNKVITDVIIKMRSYWSRQSPHPIFSYKNEKCGHRCTQRERHVKMKAGIP